MVQILLVSKVNFTQDSDTEDHICCTPTVIITAAWAVSLIKMFFGMTNDADGSVVWQNCRLPFWAVYQ